MRKYFITSSILLALTLSQVYAADLEPGIYDENHTDITRTGALFENNTIDAIGNGTTIIGDLYGGTRCVFLDSGEFSFTVTNASRFSVTSQVVDGHGSSSVTVTDLTDLTAAPITESVSYFDAPTAVRYNDYEVYSVATLDPDKRYEVKFHTFVGYGLFDKVTVTGRPLTGPLALDFDGVDDRLSIADSDVLKLNNNNFTIASWIKPNSVTMDDGTIPSWENTEYRNDIIAHCQNEVAWDSWAFMIKEGKLAFRVRTSVIETEYDIVTSPNLMPLSKWTHVAVSFNNDSNILKLYVNGALVNSITTKGAPFNNASITQIGGDVGPRHGFSGAIDELSIWNKSLSLTEINLIKAEGLVKNGFRVSGTETKTYIGSLIWADLTLYLPFREGAGSKTADLSFNAASISVLNGTQWIKSTDSWNHSGSQTTNIVVKALKKGDSLSWSVNDETDLNAYRILDGETGETLELFIVDDGFYSTTVPTGKVVKLEAVTKEGNIRRIAIKTSN